MKLINFFKLIGSRYTKRYSDLESICGRIDTTDFQDAMANDRCKSFAMFYSDIYSLIEM